MGEAAACGTISPDLCPYIGHCECFKDLSMPEKTAEKRTSLCQVASRLPKRRCPFAGGASALHWNQKIPADAGTKIIDAVQELRQVGVQTRRQDFINPAILQFST